MRARNTTCKASMGIYFENANRNLSLCMRLAAGCGRMKTNVTWLTLVDLKSDTVCLNHLFYCKTKKK